MQQAVFENLPHLIFCMDYQSTFFKTHHLTAQLFSTTSEMPITYFSVNAGDPPIPVMLTLEGTYAD
jgi:hypothetical protein